MPHDVRVFNMAASPEEAGSTAGARFSRTPPSRLANAIHAITHANPPRPRIANIHRQPKRATRTAVSGKPIAVPIFVPEK